MTDLLSIAAFAADQIPCDFYRVAGIDVHYVVGIYGPMVEIQIDYRCDHETCATNRALSTQPTFSCLFDASAPMTEAPEEWCPHGTDTSCTCLDDNEVCVMVGCHKGQSGYFGSTLCHDCYYAVTSPEPCDHSGEIFTDTIHSRTATIIAESRQANVEAISTFNESVDEIVETTGKRTRRDGVIRTAGAERYSLATGKGRSDASLIAGVLLQGTETWSMNNAKRDHSLPKRALSMASSRGRCTPDMLHSLMAFFSNPTDMAQTMLLSFLPTKIATAQATALLSDPFVVDVIEGLGVKVPTASEAVKACKNPSTGRSGRAPSRLLIADGVTAPTVDAKRRGRPSGPKYVAHLTFGQSPIQTCHDVSGIPGGNDVAQGAGHKQGAGWDSGWNGPLTPAQLVRKNAAYDAYHLAASKQAEAE